MSESMADKRPMCGQNAAGLCSFRPIEMGKCEKADFLRPECGRRGKEKNHAGRLLAACRPRFDPGPPINDLLAKKHFSLLSLSETCHAFTDIQAIIKTRSLPAGGVNNL